MVVLWFRAQDRESIERNFKQQVAYLKTVPSANFEYAMKIRVRAASDIEASPSSASWSSVTVFLSSQ